MPMDKVQEIFVESCLEHLKSIESSILDLENALPEARARAIGLIFRAAHSIKGDAASMRLNNVGRLAHTLESLLQSIREETIAISRSLIDELLAGFDLLRTLITSPGMGEARDIAPRIDFLGKLAGRPAASERVGPPRVQPPGQDEPAERVAEPEAGRASAKAAGERDGQSGPGPAVPASAIAHLSIPSYQLDVLVNRVGELGIAQSRLLRLAREERNDRLLPVIEEIEALCSLLRDQVLSLRLLPLKVSFAKYRRLVRDTCSQLGKQADFSMDGQNTELDKKLIEELNTPLIHLLRNAVGHGIETPDVRQARGKSPQGRIVIAAEQVGAEVVIEVSDDGQGIDTGKLMQAAIAAGRLDPGQTLAHREALELIFLPGVSTAETLGDVSGRGVGMDAVRESIRSLRGSIDVHSTPGQGTTFRIRLPVSLAIIDCLQIDVAGDDYFLHLDYVESCFELALSPEQRSRPPRQIGREGAVLPLVPLRAFFGLPGQAPPLSHVVVVSAGTCRFGLIVDNVIGQHQAVLKQLGPFLGTVEGILGATVCENGAMGLILDIATLAETALAEDGLRFD